MGASICVRLSPPHPRRSFSFLSSFFLLDPCLPFLHNSTTTSHFSLSPKKLPHNEFVGHLPTSHSDAALSSFLSLTAFVPFQFGVRPALPNPLEPRLDPRQGFDHVLRRCPTAHQCWTFAAFAQPTFYTQTQDRGVSPLRPCSFGG